MKKPNEILSGIKAAVVEFFTPASDNSDEPAVESKPRKRETVTWQNSAGQIVTGTRGTFEKLEKIAQASIDSYVLHCDTATPESSITNAKGIAEQFEFVAKGAKVIDDVQDGEGRYRFTVCPNRLSGPRQLI